MQVLNNQKMFLIPLLTLGCTVFLVVDSCIILQWVHDTLAEHFSAAHPTLLCNTVHYCVVILVVLGGFCDCVFVLYLFFGGGGKQVKDF